MNDHTISKGFDIRIAGKAERKVEAAPEPLLVAVQATEFLGAEHPGIKAKVLVKEGDTVQTGQPLFFDKKDPDTHFVSPATGTVSAIVLGARRALQRIEITPGTGDDFADIPHVGRDALASTPRGDLVAAIKRAGLWPLLRQRPVGRIAKDSQAPAAVFVNGMDTEPLAADPGFCVAGRKAELEAGFALLKELCGGKTYLTVAKGDSTPEFQGLHGVEVHSFAGPHPAGLVGTHIQEIQPLKTGETAWCLKAQEAALLGEWVLTGKYPTHRVVAVAGTSAPTKQYYHVRSGAALMTLTGGKPLGAETRVINGTVLSGEAVGGEGFLGYYTWTVTAMPDGGDQRDMFGWALPQVGKHSASRAVFSWLSPKSEYELDARMHGGPRAFVNIGTWEEMTPLDIHPTYLLRAIQANDLEEAINLGLLEVTEEDVALCTFADPCKIEAGTIIRKGLDLYEAES